jgi:hypothetical protein
MKRNLLRMRDEGRRPLRASLARIAVALLVVSLAVGMAGCPKAKQAAIIMRDFSVALEKVQNAEIIVHASGGISDPDHQNNQAWIEQIATAGRDANDALQAGQNASGLEALDRVLVTIDTLDRDGVTRIKNPDKQLLMSALIGSLRGVVRTAQAFVQK